MLPMANTFSFITRTFAHTKTTTCVGVLFFTSRFMIRWLKKRANALPPQLSDVFDIDCLQLLIHIHVKQLQNMMQQTTPAGAV